MEEINSTYISPTVRIIIGLCLVLCTIVFVLYAEYNSKSWYLVIIFSILSLACFTEGKFARFLGSCIAFFAIMLMFYAITLNIIFFEFTLHQIIRLLISLLLQSCVIFICVTYIKTRKFGFGMYTPSQRIESLEWFNVTFNDEYIFLDVKSRTYRDWKKGFKEVIEKPLSRKFRWVDISEISFVASGLYESDYILIGYKNNNSGEVIPTEAKGADKLWEEIISSGLFDKEIAVEAMKSDRGVFIGYEK